MLLHHCLVLTSVTAFLLVRAVVLAAYIIAAAARTFVGAAAVLLDLTTRLHRDVVDTVAVALIPLICRRKHGERNCRVSRAGCTATTSQSSHWQQHDREPVCARGTVLVLASGSCGGALTRACRKYCPSRSYSIKSPVPRHAAFTSVMDACMRAAQRSAA